MNLENLDDYIIEDIEVDDHPSDFIVRDSFVSLILRLPEVNTNIKVDSFAFILKDNTIYIYNRDSKMLDRLGNLDDLSKMLNKKIDKLILDVKRLHLDIDNMEESLYSQRVSEKFLDRWLEYKKKISLINRLMFYASVTIELFISYLKKNSYQYNKHALEDISEEINRVANLSKYMVEKLDNLYSFYRAKVDEKMNSNMYYLTMISGLFLPLTLLTGFFGMNTGGLPWVNDPLGTWKVVGISLFLEIIFFLPLFLKSKKGY